MIGNFSSDRELRTGPTAEAHVPGIAR